jgi:hypothetical protein
MPGGKMNRLFVQATFAVAALLVLAGSTPLCAQQATPQAFLAPPRLLEKNPAGGNLLTAQVAPSGCKPDGDITRDGNLVTLHLVAKVAPNQINDPGQNGGKQDVRLRSYGGCLTGPVIEVKPGNTLRLFLDNALDVNDPSCPAGAHAGPGCYNTMNMHYHGLHVSPAGNSDNVLLNIGPHTKFEYEVNVPIDHPSGTFWYHPHRHGSTALQVASGASGALIIRGRPALHRQGPRRHRHHPPRCLGQADDGADLPVPADSVCVLRFQRKSHC